MNMLRVWGGGVFLPSAFYDECDRLGLLLYHDLMFSTTTVTHEPTFGSKSVEDELVGVVRRMSHRPSLILWNGCNECDYKAPAYERFALPIVAREDPSRVIWPGSPSLGWVSGVHTLTGTPDE